jgi:hypothetical protein
VSARAIGTLGLASFALIVVGGLIEPLWLAPGTTASPAEVAAYVARNRDGFIASIFFFGLGMTAFLAFAAALTAWLAERGVGRPLLAIFGFGSASLTTLVLAGFVPVLVLAYRSPGAGTPRELYDLSFGILAVSGLPTALALGAFAAIVLSERTLPGWTAWLAVIGALAHLVVAASFFFDSGFFSLEGGVIVAIPITLFLWFAGTGLALVRLPAAASPS